jgi:hypothetical protein
MILDALANKLQKRFQKFLRVNLSCLDETSTTQEQPTSPDPTTTKSTITSTPTTPSTKLTTISPAISVKVLNAGCYDKKYFYLCFDT